MATQHDAGDMQTGLSAVIAWHGRICACALAQVSAAGAYCSASATPPLGTTVLLRHGVAGQVTGTVTRHGMDGFVVAFTREPRAASFAMKAAMLALTTPPWSLENLSVNAR